MNIEQEYDYDEELLNENGLRDGEHVYSEDEELCYRHNYSNGVLIKSADYRVSIDGIKPLEGSYKDGLPYEGYFVSFIDQEIPLVDFFKKGEIYFQYGVASIFDLDSEEYSDGNYNFIKTNYKNGKPWNGIRQEMVDLESGAHLFYTEHFKDGLISHVELLLLAVHYGEMILLEFLPDGYKLFKEGESNNEEIEIDENGDFDDGSIEVKFFDAEKNNGSISFFLGETITDFYKFSVQDISVEPIPALGQILYFPKENGYQYKQRYERTDKTDMDYYNTGLMMNVFRSLEQQLIPVFSRDGGNDYSVFFDLNNPQKFISVLFLNEKGAPRLGFKIEKDTLPDTYKYSYYQDFKALASGVALGPEALEPLVIFKNNN